MAFIYDVWEILQKKTTNQDAYNQHQYECI